MDGHGTVMHEQCLRCNIDREAWKLTCLQPRPEQWHSACPYRQRQRDQAKIEQEHTVLNAKFIIYFCKPGKSSVFDTRQAREEESVKKAGTERCIYLYSTVQTMIITRTSCSHIEISRKSLRNQDNTPARKRKKKRFTPWRAPNSCCQV